MRLSEEEFQKRAGELEVYLGSLDWESWEPWASVWCAWVDGWRVHLQPTGAVCYIEDGEDIDVHHEPYEPDWAKALAAAMGKGPWFRMYECPYCGEMRGDEHTCPHRRGHV